MRIAIWHNLPSGGGKRALYYQIQGLLERGHYIEVWSPPTADRTYLPLDPLITEHLVPLNTRKRAASALRVHSVDHYVFSLARLRAMDVHCKECADQMSSGNFDVLFANSCMYYRSTPIGRHSTLPSVLYLQEPYRPLYEAMPRLPWLAIEETNGPWWRVSYLKRFARDVLAVHALRIQAREEVRNSAHFGQILVNSRYSRESVLRAYGLDARVCYLGVDGARFRNLELPRENMVVGLGAFVPEKNIPFVLRAIATLPQPRPNLVWIGNVASDSYVRELGDLANTLCVGFRPLVGVADDEVIQLLNRASVMAYAPRLEPFGFAPLEAGACALPVVAVPEGGVRETVIDGINGLLVDPEPDAMGEAIARILDDKEEARRMGLRGRDLVLEKWSLKSANLRLEGFLLDAASQSKADPT